MSKANGLIPKVWPSIEEIAEEVKSGRVSALGQVNKALSAITELNPKFDAILQTLDTRARARAKEIDTAMKKGVKAGRLAGVPFIAKDNFLVFGAETTAASNMLKGYIAPYQSTAIERLEAEGAICVAKANLDAFAHGASTENSDFITTKNPYDISRVPGGSSGGSATAVALGMAPFALGTDTGGSIRQPASFCGVVGYKPTYGLVSRSGVVAMASSTDVIGPLTNSVKDAALILDVMSGKDVLDSTTIERDSKPYTELSGGLKGKKIGIIKEYFDEGLDPGVRAEIERVIEVLKKEGAVVSEVSLPSVAMALAVYYIIVPAELSSNLARYDGQRYESSIKGAKTLEDSYLESRSKGFGAEAKRRIMIGAYVLSSGYYDAYYKKAQTVRTKLINEVNEVYKKVDFLIGPVSPTTAFKVGDNSKDPLKMYLQDIMTVAANLTGMPAISIPCGFSDKLPVGFQIMAQFGNDKELLRVSSALEKVAV